MKTNLELNSTSLQQNVNFAHAQIAATVLAIAALLQQLQTANHVRVLAQSLQQTLICIRSAN